MPATQIGLVDSNGVLAADLVQAAAAAINAQLLNEFMRCWSIPATVQYLTDPTNIPSGVQPVYLVQVIPPTADGMQVGGIHLDDNHQPWAQVIATPADNSWTIDASHEIIEMVVDPSCKLHQTSQAIGIVGGDVQDQPGQYQYLVEACDPCQDHQYAYPSQTGIALSDFITPHFYDPAASAGVAYSFRGNITRPRQILPGGYITYTDPQTNDVNQILWLGGNLTTSNLGPATAAAVRTFVDAKTDRLVRSQRKPNDALMGHCREQREVSKAAGARRAARFAKAMGLGSK